nr:hypothetical protein [uncultured Mediterraneibacter sp.]
MDINSLCEVISKKYTKAIEVPNEEYIRIPIKLEEDTIEFEIHFNRIYKDLDGNLNKKENAIQFICDRDDEYKEYLTSYKGIKKEKIYANMMRGIFYHNPMNEEVDTEEHVVEVFNIFVGTRTMPRVKNHREYVDRFIILYKHLFEENDLDSETKAALKAVLAIEDGNYVKEDGKCDETKKLMSIVRKKMVNKGYLDKDWFDIIGGINKEKIAFIRGEMLTKKYLELAWKDKDEDENTKRELDKKNTGYSDDGWGEYPGISKYYYANSLDHYLTHLVSGIVKTQTNGTRINFGEVFDDIRDAIDEILKGNTVKQ